MGRVDVLTRFSTYALVIDDSPPAGIDLLVGVQHTVVDGRAERPAARSSASNTLLVWLEDVLGLWLDLSCR